MANIRTVHDDRYRMSQGSNPPPYRQQQDSSDSSDAKGISMMRLPGAPGQQPQFMDYLFPRADWRTFTCFMSIVQVILFVVTLIVGATMFDGAFVSTNSLAGPSATTLDYMGGKNEDKIRNHYAVWRLITPIFLHAGVLHILGNLFFQLRFGFIFELRWGWLKFAAIYFICGIGASLWSCVISPVPISVGASGALFGLIGADYAYLIYNWAEIPDQKNELVMLLIVTVINFLFGIGPGVDNSAHLGGLVTGFLVAVSLLDTLVKRENEKYWRSASAAATASVFLMFICLLWAGDPMKY